VLSWRDHVEDGAPIDERRHRRDQAGVPQEVELAGRGRSAQAELCGDRRGSSGADRQEGDDPTPRRVGEEFDPGPRRCGMTGRSWRPALHCQFRRRGRSAVA
jgi:hypothetical protein